MYNHIMSIERSTRSGITLPFSSCSTRAIGPPTSQPRQRVKRRYHIDTSSQHDVVEKLEFDMRQPKQVGEGQTHGASITGFILTHIYRKGFILA
jgi:hypothetical protein